MNKHNDSNIDWGKMPVLLWAVIFIGASFFLFSAVIQKGTNSNVLGAKTVFAESTEAEGATVITENHDTVPQYSLDPIKDSNNNENGSGYGENHDNHDGNNNEHHDGDNDNNEHHDGDNHDNHDGNDNDHHDGDGHNGGSDENLTKVKLVATPDHITKGQSSVLSWTSSNVKNCKAKWTSNTDASGSQTVTPTTTTEYLIQCSGKYGDTDDSVTVVVKEAPSAGNSATIIASKIVCNLESDLPNFGLGGPDITATTATAFVAEHKGCRLEPGWQFQWGPASVIDPGRAFIGVAGGDWTTFDSVTNANGQTTTKVNISNVGDRIWVREVLKENYIPFTYDQTHKSNADAITAELYCNKDVLNYDNYDYVSSPQKGGTYYCVAWNVSKTPNNGSTTPSVTLSANPSTIAPGATSTLSWTSVNTSSCAASWTLSTSTSGSQIVSLATTTAYSILCTGSNGNASATTTITVTTSGGGGNDISVVLSANPTTITPGATSTLSWVSTNAANCSAPWTSATTTSGNQIVSPATTTAYSITCVNGSNQASSSATVIVSTDGSGGGSTTTPAVTLTANPDTITIGESSTLSWTSSNVSICSALWTTATSTSGSLAIAATTTTSYEIVCSGVNGNATSTATITVNPLSTGGGGGGGSSSGGGGGGGSSSGGGGSGIGGSNDSLLGASCEYLKDYLKIDWTNDPVEVTKLQVFLKELEGFSDLAITGVFDQATYEAVATFQERYFDDVLAPWGHTSATHFVYILTKKKVNEIVCRHAYPLNADQITEIQNYKAFLATLGEQGLGAPTQKSGTTNESSASLIKDNSFFNDGISSTSPVGGVMKPSLLERLFGGQSARNIAVAVITGPQGWNESLNSILTFLVILLALYLIVSGIVERQNNKHSLTLDSQRTRKIFYYTIGLILATIGALVLKFYTIVLPLIVLIIVLSIANLWFLFSKKETRSITVVDTDSPEF